jgi:putative two-component system response regulator
MLCEAGHYNDDDTSPHIWRIGGYSRALAKVSGWDEERCNLIELAAPMHDTGKIGIPDSILRKASKLNDEEWDIMKTHSRIGYDILCKGGDSPLFAMAAEIALHHHERWDGSGYPHGLAGDDISEAARVVAVVDVFDALTSKRPYKEAWTVAQALAEIEQSAGSHLDPQMVARFLGLGDRIVEIRALWEKRECDLSLGAPTAP